MAFIGDIGLSRPPIQPPVRQLPQIHYPPGGPGGIGLATPLGGSAPQVHRRPHQITGDLLNATHAAVAAHPHPARKAAFAKILAALAAEQAKEHADGAYAGSTGDAGQGGYGGNVAEQTQGEATPMTAVPHERLFQALQPEDGGFSAGDVQAAPLSLVDILRGQLGGPVRYY